MELVYGRPLGLPGGSPGGSWVTLSGLVCHLNLNRSWPSEAPGVANQGVPSQKAYLKALSVDSEVYTMVQGVHEKSSSLYSLLLLQISL